MPQDMIKDAEEKAKLMDQVALFVQAHPLQTVHPMLAWLVCLFVAAATLCICLAYPELKLEVSPG